MYCDVLAPGEGVVVVRIYLWLGQRRVAVFLGA